MGSRDAEERLLALAAVNIYDEETGSRFGVSVISKFVRQDGGEIKKRPALGKESREGGLFDERVVRIAAEVGKALGPIVGARLDFVRQVSQEESLFDVTSNIPGAIPTIRTWRDPLPDAVRESMSAEYLCIILVTGTGESKMNTHLAMSALGAFPDEEQ